MTYVVCAPCVDCEYTQCASVCPVDAFHRDEPGRLLVINPSTCIDCDACRLECPVAAIFPEPDVPAEWQSYVELNASRAEECPVVSSIDPVREPRSREGRCSPVQ